MPVMSHPAKYSLGVMAAILDALGTYPPPGKLVLDPMAGTGRIHELRQYGYVTKGIELEPEWAAMHPLTEVGDATALDACWSKRFAAVITSPPYGNRMADSYAGDFKPCPDCPTHTGGLVDAWCICKTCNGTGTFSSRRHTYRIALGRELTDGSAAGMQWHEGPAGDDYRKTMARVLREIRRVLMPGGLFLLNVKNHIRDGKEQLVCQWYEEECQRALSFNLVEWHEVSTPSMRHGENHALRCTERLYVFRKP
jgi:tRNA G10  N-methylase Trm11